MSAGSGTAASLQRKGEQNVGRGKLQHGILLSRIPDRAGLRVCGIFYCKLERRRAQESGQKPLKALGTGMHSEELFKHF